VKVRLVVEPAEEADPEVLDRLTRRLRAEVAELDVDAALEAEEPPEGAKSADAVTIGAIVVALSASGGVFNALVETLRDWLRRQSERHKVSITIDGDTIELERADSEQKQALVDAYVARHTRSE
jgi:hypothetical protein